MPTANVHHDHHSVPPNRTDTHRAPHDNRPKRGARFRHRAAHLREIHPLNWLRATVAGAEEALVSAGMAFAGLAGLAAASEGAPSGAAAVAVSLVAGGVGHIVSETNARAVEHEAEQADAKKTLHKHEHHDAEHTDHHGQEHDHSHKHTGHHHGHSHGYVSKSPTITALSSASSYALGTALPAAAYWASDGSITSTMAATTVGLFTLGAFVSRFTDRGALRTGARQVLSGVVSMGAFFAAPFALEAIQNPTALAPNASTVASIAALTIGLEALRRHRKTRKAGSTGPRNKVAPQGSWAYARRETLSSFFSTRAVNAGHRRNATLRELGLPEHVDSHPLTEERIHPRERASLNLRVQGYAPSAYEGSARRLRKLRQREARLGSRQAWYRRAARNQARRMQGTQLAQADER
ncbi:MAG: hypothetical protein HOQ05_02325, partial [Corynebacteriales bacterium]|nr:hypothetical protein [Mycobacteriales bacterium]